MGNLIWHNGDFKNGDKAAFSPHTRLRLGEGVFNTVLAIDGKLQYAEAHFTKLLKNSHIFWPDWRAPEPQPSSMPRMNCYASITHRTDGR